MNQKKIQKFKTKMEHESERVKVSANCPQKMKMVILNCDLMRASRKLFLDSGVS